MKHPGHAARCSRPEVAVVAAFCVVMMLIGAGADRGEAVAAPMAASTLQSMSPADSTIPVPEPEPEPAMAGTRDPVPAAARIRVGAHTFLTNRMSDTYDPVITASIEFLTVKKGFGLGFEIGWTRGDGTPPLAGSNWLVGDSWVKMSAMLFEVNAYYNFSDDTGSGLFGPYAAMGPGVWVGSERISVDASRAPVGFVEGFQVEQLALGASFAMSAMVGTTVRIKDRIRGLVEARYVLGTGGTLDLVPEEEDTDRLDATLYSAVQRPGFNFTGWQVTFGVQW